MFKIAKRIIVAVFTTVLLCALLCSCKKYDENWILGKSYDEIVEKYGEFDEIRHTPLGVVKSGWYLTRDSGTDYLDEYYAIFFDSDGIAVEIREKHYATGG